MHIHPVRTKQELASFLDFPYRLYKDDPVWVPPLRDEQCGQFDQKRNPLLDHCEWQLFLLEKDGKFIGRIAAFIDTLAIEFWKERIGLFGYYECISDLQAARTLVRGSPGLAADQELHLYARTVDLCLTGMGAGGGRLYTIAGGNGPLQPALL